jgi:hypothetical protein
MTQAEHLADLEKRVRVLEEFKGQVTGAWSAAKAAWAAVAVNVLIIGGFVYHYGGLTTSVNNHKEELTRLDGSLVKLGTGLEKIGNRVDSLRVYVTVLMDRDPKGAPKVPEAIVYRGRVLEVTANTITVLDDNPGEPARKFVLGPESKVSLNGKDAQLADVRAGMTAELTRIGGQVTMIAATGAKQ